MKRYEKFEIIIGTNDDEFDFSDPSRFDWSTKLLMTKEKGPVRMTM